MSVTLLQCHKLHEFHELQTTLLISCAVSKPIFPLEFSNPRMAAASFFLFVKFA